MIISTSDNVKLNVQKTGEGTAVLFLHEFGGDQRSWKPQINFFSRRYKCITFNLSLIHILHCRRIEMCR